MQQFPNWPQKSRRWTSQNECEARLYSQNLQLSRDEDTGSMDVQRRLELGPGAGAGALLTGLRKM